MNKMYIAGIIVVAAIAVSSAAYVMSRNEISGDISPKVYTYNVVNVYPHDTTAFTQGLIFEDGIFYEGTGIHSKSKLRKVNLEDGSTIQSYSLPDSYFGEGITTLNDQIIQLTWQENAGFVYEKDTFRPLGNFTYATEGWGLTNDGEKLIMSDGTATLQFLDPETFQVIGTIEVQDESRPVLYLNELEYVEGDVYANIYGQKQIAIIDIHSGQVKSWIDLNGLSDPNYSDQNVLNGIAYDKVGDRLFVTGKCWSQIFEIKLQPKP